MRFQSVLGPVRYEQAVYGSFPFWDRGYAVLARSPGCRPVWIEALRQAAQRFGERPAGVVERDGLLALPLAGGPRMIIGVFPQGDDDRGRPGALAFHALFVTRWAYRRAGASPFVFVPALRREWGVADAKSPLPPGQIGPAPALGTDPPESPWAVPAARIALELERGRRVLIVRPEPIDELARLVWHGLSPGVRRGASLATWTFNAADRFDLAAVPRMSHAGPVPSPAFLELSVGGPASERLLTCSLPRPESDRGPFRWIRRRGGHK